VIRNKPRITRQRKGAGFILQVEHLQVLEIGICYKWNKEDLEKAALLLALNLRLLLNPIGQNN
jgi:hypothetical protein